MIFVSSLASASDSPPAHARVHRARPSNFDFLVLASIADSPRVLSMASYRPTVGPRKVPAPPGKPSRETAEN